jgi:2-methylcitrate dehydratase PrpD
MICIENPEFTADYLDPSKRSIANAVQIFYKDGSNSERVTVEYPIGHRRRRKEGIPELIKKFDVNLNREFDKNHSDKIMQLNLDLDQLRQTPVNEYVDLFVK